MQEHLKIKRVISLFHLIYVHQKIQSVIEQNETRLISSFTRALCDCLKLDLKELLVTVT